MTPKVLSQRVALSPGEFAALFGKSQTWGYRQIYAGKVKAITEYGRIQIPATEVERVLASAGIYNGMPEEAQKSSKRDEHELGVKAGELWLRRGVDSRKAATGEAEIIDPEFSQRNPENIEEAERMGINKIAGEVFELRTKAGLSQQELAELAGTSATVVSRLEEADYDRYSLVTLSRIAAALNRRIEIRFLPAHPVPVREPMPEQIESPFS